ncbi:MAG TPA: peptidoglycan recognition family protein [Candidatus Saccharimonadales bacterium]|nr:peptidoglycan recognition family protein [Candidatus Saccharimonadales bacterium]
MAATIGGDASTAANCPPDVQCEVDLAALKDGGCNWSTAKRPSDLPVYGITEHTTEGSLAEALAEAQDTSKCISWNYLIDQTGKVYVSVPKDSLAYDVGNWWVNTHYVQVEHVGRAEDCSTLTPAEYAASIKLDHWLIRQFRIQPSSATIAGHDSYPAVNDAGMASRHWDPGICWPWATYLAAVGAPIVPTAAPNAPVVTIKAKDSHQSVQDCPGVGFSGCVAAAQDTTNFLALHTAPSAASPLLADPYLHPDGSSGSTAMQDWGDKAPTGHAYVVLARKAGWTEIQYGGTNAWFQDTGKFTVPTTALVVRPKANQAVPIYGRPMPEYDAPGWQSIPYDHQQQVALTKYMMQPGQRYVVASVPQPRTDYAEGCNLADCSGPGDMTVVIGNEKYYEISWSHHYAFVKAADVAVTPAR